MFLHVLHVVVHLTTSHICVHFNCLYQIFLMKLRFCSPKTGKLLICREVALWRLRSTVTCLSRLAEYQFCQTEIANQQSRLRRVNINPRKAFYIYDHETRKNGNYLLNMHITSKSPWRVVAVFEFMTHRQLDSHTGV